MLTPPGSPSPDNLTNPFAREKQPPTDTSVIGALLGADAAEDFTALLPHQEQEIPQKADLPGGELALSPEEKARADAKERETPEQRARAWFLSLGKDERWIEEHFTFEDGITCIAKELDLSDCNIEKLPSFFKEMRGITNLDLCDNPLATLQNIPKEIGGNLWLSRNPKLASCAGLEGVSVRGSLSLSYNPSLASLAGLEEVHVGGDIYLNNNSSLTSCVGLEEATIKRSLWLNNNPSLTSLEGLPPVGNIEGELVFSKDQEHLIQEAREKGYNVRIIT